MTARLCRFESCRAPRAQTGDEAHGEHDNTHYHTLPHSGADGRGLSPVKREVRVRVPASSTTTHGPERLGYRLENAPTTPTCPCEQCISET